MPGMGREPPRRKRKPELGARRPGVRRRRRSFPCRRKRQGEKPGSLLSGGNKYMDAGCCPIPFPGNRAAFFCLPARAIPAPGLRQGPAVLPGFLDTAAVRIKIQAGRKTGERSPAVQSGLMDRIQGRMKMKAERKRNRQEKARNGIWEEKSFEKGAVLRRSPAPGHGPSPACGRDAESAAGFLFQPEGEEGTPRGWG